MTVYGKGNAIVGEWTIEDRTESEAESEALADVERDFPDSLDWTLMPNRRAYLVVVDPENYFYAEAESADDALIQAANANGLTWAMASRVELLSAEDAARYRGEEEIPHKGDSADSPNCR